MPYIYKPLNRFESKELIREIHQTAIVIASIEYDLNLAIYLKHPADIKDSYAEEIQEYKEYEKILSEELKKRG